VASEFQDPGWLKKERKLVARARRGDREAFGALYRAFAAALYRRVLLPKLQDPASAEDALAETFVTAWQRLDAYEDRGLSLFSWLARIAANKAIDLHRGRGRADRASANLERMIEPLLAPVPGEDEELVRQLDAPALRARVAATLDRLRPRYRQAIELRFMQGLDRRACSQALGVKLSTFYVLLLRALRAFRKEWDHDG
jgi:RNA polymerase sigma-70 factor (ECF subfamily)